MAYRVEFSPAALRHLARVPDPVKWELAELFAEIALDPRDPVTTEPTQDPDVRWTTFASGAGFVQFHVWDALVIVTVLDIAWIG